MKYFLDTNICIYYLNGTSGTVLQKIDATDMEDLLLPSVVTGELYYGAMKSTRRKHNLERYHQFISTMEVAAFDLNASRIYGAIRTDLESQGRPIGWNDLMIAAIVLANRGVLVTHNIGEFSRIDRLTIEDWTSTT